MNPSYADDIPKGLRKSAEQLLKHSSLFASLLRDISPEACANLFKPEKTALLPKVGEVWFPEVDSSDLNVCMQHLRQLKQQAMRHIIWWELGVHGDIETSYRSISDTASALLSQAITMAERLISPRFGQLEDFSFCVIGLGKLGGRELNLGSDVDLLFIWQGEGNTQGGRKSIPAKEYYNHFSRMFIRLIDEITIDGLVWPVDMRLRPGGDGSPICLNLDATMSHYLEYGQTWERAMLIKARPVAGDMSLGESFITGISPFVYRRYLDYSSVAALADMKRRIDAQTGSVEIQVGFDVKKGKGGIREIEFIIQSLQLIHGGRHPDLRNHEGKSALDVLVVLGYLPKEEAEKLFNAYLFWRRIEHAIQARKGEQTQLLPEGYETYLQQVLCLGNAQEAMHKTSKWVSFVFHERVLPLVGDEECNHESWLDGSCLDKEESLSDEDRSRISQALLQIDKQLLRGVLPERSRQQVESILCIAMPRWIQKKRGVDAVQAFADLLHAISGRATWLDLLATHRGTLEWLIDILSASKYLSSQIINNPSWLEWPLENENGGFENQRLCTAIDALDGCDEESFLRDLGRYVDQARLLCALHIHADREGPLVIGGWLADIADSVVQACLRSSLQQLQLPQDFQLVALAMGKHGSREMGLVSDLDMVFVLVEDPTKVIHGRTSREWAQRLGRRMIRQITGMPPFGAGYEFDARLRPSGNSGVLVVTLDGFVEYQLHKAQTWEHQALCRARAVTGSSYARRKVMKTVEDIIEQPHDIKALAQDILVMRKKMLKHLSSKEVGKINLKQDKGGLIDIEFLAQFLRLMFGGNEVGTVAILEKGVSDVPPKWQIYAKKMAKTYVEYRELENILRVEMWASIGELPTDENSDIWLCLQQRAKISSLKVLQEVMREVHSIFVEILD